MTRALREVTVTLAELLGDARMKAVAAVALAVAQAVLLLPVALLVRRIFDSEVPAHDETAIVVAGLLVLACYGASAALSVASRTLASRTAKIALSATRRRLIAQLETLPLSWHDRHDVAELHATVTLHCERVDKMLNALMSQVLPAGAALLALAVVAVVINPVLFAVLAVFVPLMLLSTRRFARAYNLALSEWHRTAEAFGGHTHVLLSALKTIRAAGAEDRDRERFQQESDAFVDAGYRAAVTGSRHQALQSSLAAFAGVAVLVVGGLLVSREQLTVGGLLAFYAVVALMLRQLSTALAAAPAVLEGSVSMARVRALGNASEPGAYEGTRRIEFSGSIDMDDVTFGYGDAKALDAVNLRIGRGELVTIVGENGAGKSTLLALMLGLYRPQRGTVCADGVPLEELDLGDLRRQIGVILQEPVLFAGTIRENLLLSGADPDEAAVRDALVASTAAEIVDGLPRGVETVLGDGGSGLSGGERQRVAIARAILARPALILLDEPTSHLPAEVGAQVVENLSELPWRPTIVVVTHDPDVASGPTRQVRLKGGRVLSEAPR
jgi:ATP-binding cassette subfamily B protein